MSPDPSLVMSAAKDFDKSVPKPSQGILRPTEAALTGRSDL
jgi:hypothetical protein